MTRTEAMTRHLLSEGGKLSIKNGYNLFGISNISREVRRLIEQPFGIELKREQKKGKTKYGTPCQWYEYSATPKVKPVLRKKLREISG